MNQSQRTELIEAASQVRRSAYARYSGFRVGAALLTSDGRIHLGANVENVSYGLTICAERAAVAAALAAGDRQFTALAIATAGGGAPCGACRQVLAEFCDELPILLVNVDDDNAVRDVDLKDLLPDRFNL